MNVQRTRSVSTYLNSIANEEVRIPPIHDRNLNIFHDSFLFCIPKKAQSPKWPELRVEKWMNVSKNMLGKYLE